MNLKDATIAVLICVGISVAWAVLSLVLPSQVLRVILQSKVPSLLYIAKDISLMVFFAILLRNQK